MSIVTTQLIDIDIWTENKVVAQPNLLLNKEFIKK